MDASLIKFIVFAYFAVIVDGQPKSHSKIRQDLPRYLVFPGLDANRDEIKEWSYGYASPFNILFGPKPYVFGWLGGTSFGPVPNDDDGELGIEGEIDSENAEEEVEEGIDEENPE